MDPGLRWTLGQRPEPEDLTTVHQSCSCSVQDLDRERTARWVLDFGVSQEFVLGFRGLDMEMLHDNNCTVVVLLLHRM